MSVIELRDVTFQYNNNEHKALDNVNFSVNEGEIIILTGKSGSGKSTILQVVNGLIPHFFSGELSGEVLVYGENTEDRTVQELSKQIGSVFQNPKAQFFNLHAEDELAFTPSNHNVSADEIRKRQEETVEKFHLKELMDRNILTLSSGEMQKLACGSVYMNLPKIYLFDEPSSNLDEKGIEQLMHTLEEIKKSGSTVLIAEHRIYYALDMCDRIIYMEDGKLRSEFSREEVQSFSHEKIMQLGLRSSVLPTLDKVPTTFSGETVNVEKLFCEKKGKTILNLANISLPKGKIIAITGENGVGKTTFVKCFCGIMKSNITVLDEKILPKKDRIKRSFLVMQDVNTQLSCETVYDELVEKETEENSKKALAILESLDLSDKKDEHPFALSGGQKQRVAIATALFLDKKYIFLDEPTSGLDYDSMAKVSELIKEISKNTDVVAVVTHDKEFISQCCDYEINFSKDGKINLYEIISK